MVVKNMENDLISSTWRAVINLHFWKAVVVQYGSNVGGAALLYCAGCRR